MNKYTKGGRSGPIRILLLTRYGRLGASSRLRFLQYLPWIQRAGIQVVVQSLLSDDLLQARYQHGFYDMKKLLYSYACRLKVLLNRFDYDVVWIEKESLPWWPLWIEVSLLRGVPYVLDYDDAVFHSYDQHAKAWIRYLYGQRLSRLMADAALVICGNNYLAQYARDAGAPRVEVLPTVIDLERYPHRAQTSPLCDPPRIAWIGSPATVHYLQVLHEPLQKLAERQAFILRVIGGKEVEMIGVQIEVVPWSETTEVQEISDCSIGVMPLNDSPWEWGKCGYKLIQYMACSLPVVASPIGVNCEIVGVNENGFLADSVSEWIDALGRLLGDTTLQQEFGEAGRRRVEEKYCIQKTAPLLISLLEMVVGRN